jgi:hypothetical protein
MFSNWPGHEFSDIDHNFMFLMILGEVFCKNSEWEEFQRISKSDSYSVSNILILFLSIAKYMCNHG